MGLFGNIISSIGKKVSTALDYVSAPLSQPLTFITQGPTAAAKAVETSRANIAAGKESGVAKIATIVGTTAVLAGATLAAAPAAATGGAGVAARSVVSALVPNTPLKVIGTVAAAPVVYGIVKANPTAAQSAVEKAPSALSNFGANVGNLISNPTASNAINIYKENPVIAGTATAAIVGAVGLATARVVSNITNTAAVKKNTEATLNGGSNSDVIQSPTQPIQIINQIPPQATAITAPVADQTSTIKKSTPKKAVKKKSKAKKKAPVKKKKKTTKKKAKKKKK